MNDRFCKYDPDVKLFKEIGKAQLNVSGNQYRLTFDNGQMNLKLGDLVSCGGIDNGGRFVVVDVHSVYEKEDIADNPKIVNRMEVTVVPEISKDFAIPLPVDDNIKSYGSLRGSSNPYMGSKSNDASGISIRTATVDDSLDPYRMNQVKVTYEGDTYPSAEWVKVLTPFASKGNGISCKLVKGDKVLVCTIKTPTKEESFVVGSYYEGEDNTPPNGQRKFSTIIRSKNGQYIGFEESNEIFDFLGGLLPDAFRKLIEAFFIIHKGEVLEAKENSKNCNVLGGIEMSDYYGLFTIAGSSSKRSITISSPFGTVGIDAAMGITISAPNGDIKIVGKNIDIEAGNNLTLKSGTNIDSSYFKNGFSKETILNNLGNSVSNAISDLFDFSTLRFFLELLFKPIAGTLKIHSGRNLLLEANGNDAHFPDHKISKARYLTQNHIDPVGDHVSCAVKTINKWIECFKAYKKVITDTYNDLSTGKESIKNEITKSFQKKEGVVEDFDTMINTWISDKVDTNKFNEKLEKKVEAQNTDTDKENIIKKINELNDLFTQFKEKDFGEKKLETNLKGGAVDCKKIVNNLKEIRVDFNQASQIGDCLDPEGRLFKESTCQKKKLRLVVLDIIDLLGICEYGIIDKDKLDEEESWVGIINSIELKKTTKEDNLTIGATNMLIDMVNKFLPIEAFNTRSWGQETKGQILMSQNLGSTLSINGQTFKEEFDEASLAGVREAMRNATL